MKFDYLKYFVAIFLVSSCANNTGSFGKYYSNLPTRPELKSIPTEAVRLERVSSAAQFAARADVLLKNGYKAIGASGFDGTIEDESGAIALAAREGGDVVVVCREHIGRRTGSRMAIGSYTPSRTINSTSSFNGSSSVYGSANAYGTSGYGNAYSSAQGTFTGTSNSSVYIPSQTTYIRESFDYDAYSQGAGIFASPARLAAAREKN